MRLRIGVLLWVLSWIPYAVIFGLTGYARTLSWLVEIGLGIAGIAIAGSEFGVAVKECGWKRAPAVAWRALVHGQRVEPGS